MNERDIGENIRTLRESVGLTLTAAAKKAALTKSALSKIETGQSSPPIATLLRIAKALNVSLVDFFTAEKKHLPYVLTRKGTGRVISRDGSRFGYSYEALGLEKRDKIAEPFLLNIKPDDPEGAFHHEGQEFIYMLSGQMSFTINDEKLILRAGDSLYFDSTNVHRTRVIGKCSAKFICVFIQQNPLGQRKAGRK
ncbi:MAG: helix-turn-helix domain-containing protein [Sedimentisphaerales bacterium]